jgi:flavorubredoxin
MFERIRAIVDPSRIDYLISNHVEQDHSGSIPDVMACAPHAKLITSSPNGLKGLQAHYGTSYDYQPVKSGDTLSIGKRTLQFVHIPMVHWPDSMVTYDAADQILFSNDAFGQHLASSERFDDQIDLPTVMEQATKYYANIVMPYCMQVQRALEACASLDIGMIAPCHGIIWRSHCADILASYHVWSTQQLEERALVVYDSMWHSTEHMAQAIVNAFTDADIPVRLFDLKCNHISDIMTEILSSRYLAVGSPTLNSTMMPTVAAFLCYLKGLMPRGMSDSGRMGFAFGSYGWAPLGPKSVASGLEAAGYQQPFGPCTHQWTLDAVDCEKLRNDVAARLKAMN